MAKQESWVWLSNSNSNFPKVAYPHPLRHYSKQTIVRATRRQQRRCTATLPVNINWFKDSKHLMASDKLVWFSHRTLQVEGWLRWLQLVQWWFKTVAAANSSMSMLWQCKIVRAIMAGGHLNSMLWIRHRILCELRQWLQLLQQCRCSNNLAVNPYTPALL